MHSCFTSISSRYVGAREQRSAQDGHDFALHHIPATAGSPPPPSPTAATTPSSSTPDAAAPSRSAAASSPSSSPRPTAATVQPSASAAPHSATQPPRNGSARTIQGTARHPLHRSAPWPRSGIFIVKIKIKKSHIRKAQQFFFFGGRFCFVLMVKKEWEVLWCMNVSVTSGRWQFNRFDNLISIQYLQLFVFFVC